MWPVSRNTEEGGMILQPHCMGEIECIYSCHHVIWCGTHTKLLCIESWGLVAPLSLSFIKRDASTFGDVKQICFAEAFCWERISPLTRCQGLFPFLVSQLSPNTYCVTLQIPCWPCSVQSHSLGMEGLKEVSTSYPVSTKISCMVQRNAARIP